ncbi:MAG: hypothetical protein FWF08_05340, partial [Oscillospiraceae bacterium]|nr:hypothetical protein [Oscillospiraceae bacterium]
FGMTPVPDSELAGVFAGAVPTGIVVYRRVYTIPGDRPEDTVHKYQYKVYKKLGEDVYQYVEPTGYSDDGNRQGAKITGLSYKFKNILPFDMFEICTITLSVDGKEFYRGSPDGNGSINMQEEAYHLGAFESGGQKIMKMTAVMDGSKLPGAAYEGEIEFWWIFNAERALPPDETTTADDDETTTGEDEEKTTDKDKTTAKTTEKDSGPDGTKTGVQFNTALYIIAGSIALAMAVVYVLILVYKKRGEKQEEIEDVLNR